MITSISTDFIHNHIALLRSNAQDENVSLHFVLSGYSEQIMKRPILFNLLVLNSCLYLNEKTG